MPCHAWVYRIMACKKIHKKSLKLHSRKTSSSRYGKAKVSFPQPPCCLTSELNWTGCVSSLNVSEIVKPPFMQKGSEFWVHELDLNEAEATQSAKLRLLCFSCFDQGCFWTESKTDKSLRNVTNFVKLKVCLLVSALKSLTRIYVQGCYAANMQKSFRGLLVKALLVVYVDMYELLKLFK